MTLVFKMFAYLLAAIYFLADAAFMTIAKPLAGWLGSHWVFQRVRDWIISLRPYPTLFLFAVPIVVLEPIKPLAIYFAATGHVATGILIFAGGEILKLVIVERLFCISCGKLLTIPAFAWAYGKYRAMKDWVVTSEPWQTVQGWSRYVVSAGRRYVLEAKTPEKIASLGYSRTQT